MTSSAKNGSKRTPRCRREAPTIPSSSSRCGHPLDDRVRVGHGQEDAHVRVLALELAEEHRDDDRRRPRRGPEHEIAGEVALRRGGDVRDELILEREQLLRPAVEPPPRFRRLDAAPGAVEELRPETLLQRPHLERDRGLRDPEPVGRLREAPPLDHRTERRQLLRVHKRTLSVNSGVWADRSRRPEAERWKGGHAFGTRSVSDAGNAVRRAMPSRGAHTVQDCQGPWGAMSTVSAQVSRQTLATRHVHKGRRRAGRGADL